MAARLLHESSACLLTILDLDRNILVNAERNARQLLEPITQLEELTTASIQSLEAVVLTENHGMRLCRQLHGKDLEHERLLGCRRLPLKGIKNLCLLFRTESLELINLVVNCVCLVRLTDELYKLLNLL